MSWIFGTNEFVDPEDFLKLIVRLGLNMATATFIILYVYFRLYRNRELVFTYYAFNVITFSLSALLRKTPMDMGFALGLFAIFGILRYRTEAIRIRDLTYLFIVLGVAILNAVANKKVSLAELLLVNVIIGGLTAVIELRTRARHVSNAPLLYDRIELLRPERRADMLIDLRARTGLDIVSIEVNRIDMLRDAADITITYRDAR